MKQVVLDGAALHTPEEIHRQLAEALSFPPYYGANLDALWDILSTKSEPVEIVLCRRTALARSVGAGYLRRLVSVFTDAARENDAVRFRLERGRR